MEPIIDPMIFYYIGVIDRLSCAFGIIGIICDVLGIGTFMFCGEEIFTYESESVRRRRYTIFSVLMCTLAVICMFAEVFLPDKQTMYKMLIAKYATKQNITSTVDFVIDSIERASEKIIQTQEDNDDRKRRR